MYNGLLEFQDTGSAIWATAVMMN